jgi:two-component system, NtrC family, sensor kinase
LSASSKLVLLTTVLVMAAVCVEGFVLLGQREEILQTATRNEALARAQIIQAAIENEYMSERKPDQRFLDQLRQGSGGDTLLVLDEHGAVGSFSGDSTIAAKLIQAPEASATLTQGRRVQTERAIDGRNYLVISLPINLSAGRRSALLLVHSLSSLEAQLARARRSLIVATMLVTLATFVIIVFVTDRYLTRPLQGLVTGTEAFGSGDLFYRVNPPHGRGALFRLTHAFNTMADRLATQRQAAEQKADEQLELERQLRQTERLAMVGRLAASIAHEIGAPLNVIDGRAEQLIAQPTASLEKRQRNLLIIRAQTKRIERIVSQLLTFVRAYEPNNQPLRLAPLVHEVMELVEPDAKAAQVSFDITGLRDFGVCADLEMVRQVFLNMCINAIQAMPAGGRLRISSQPSAANKDGRRFASIQFADTGEGIPPEQINHIFEPFFTTKGVSDGTGLGLAICQRIVEKHDGWIDVENDTAGGAIFTIHLPAEENKQEAAATAAARVTTEL